MDENGNQCDERNPTPSPTLTNPETKSNATSATPNVDKHWSLKRNADTAEPEGSPHAKSQRERSVEASPPQPENRPLVHPGGVTDTGEVVPAMVTINPMHLTLASTTPSLSPLHLTSPTQHTSTKPQTPAEVSPESSASDESSLPNILNVTDISTPGSPTDGPCLVTASQPTVINVGATEPSVDSPTELLSPVAATSSSGDVCPSETYSSDSDITKFTPKSSESGVQYFLDFFTSEEKEAIRKDAHTLGLMDFIRKHLRQYEFPTRAVIAAFAPGVAAALPMEYASSQLVSVLKMVVTQHIQRQRRLANITTVDDVVELLRKSRNIMILTGAGVSVSCGIPDFRSPNGIYARLGDFGLQDPQEMFDIEYFREAPQIFYSFARELYPSNFVPSPSHYFIRLLENRGQLLRNYTQNIDTLEHQTGIERVINCHGSFATARCIRCGHQVAGEFIKPAIFAQEVPPCPRCTSKAPESKPSPPRKHRTGWQDSNSDDSSSDNGAGSTPPAILKPDITFFGEKLPDTFEKTFLDDRHQVDLLLVIGSSLKVQPVSEVTAELPGRVPQILINRTPNLHVNFDVQLLGNCDDILSLLCHRLGWDLTHPALPGGRVLSPQFADTLPKLLPGQPRALAGDGTWQYGPANKGTPEGAHSPILIPKPTESSLTVPLHWHFFRGATVTAKDLERAHDRYPSEWFSGPPTQ
ncbi:NAD-dependent histone deacetylase sir2 [Dispira parvispora]|uniref:NAD-dependent histone deacetylase sir2 n=1 Tax=Dispira parvispora TaxID=1520584 RepID=A0A9W8AR27_9FUNG|nr:NAD-dependent histone deacetylase sir2 [Dispira parvispora]